MPNDQLLNRVNQLLREFPLRFPLRREYPGQNCHGVVAYAIGLKDSLQKISPKRLEPYCIPTKKTKTGDIIFFYGRRKKTILHSGIVMKPIKDPLIFSGHWNYGCDISTLSESLEKSDGFYRYYEFKSYAQ